MALFEKRSGDDRQNVILWGDVGKPNPWQYTTSGEGQVALTVEDKEIHGSLQYWYTVTGTKRGPVQVCFTSPGQPALSYTYDYEVFGDNTLDDKQYHMVDTRPGEKQPVLRISLGVNIMRRGGWSHTTSGPGALATATAADMPVKPGELPEPIAPGNTDFYFKGEKPGDVTLKFTCEGEYRKKMQKDHEVVYQLKVHDDLQTQVLSEDYTAWFFKD